MNVNRVAFLTTTSFAAATIASAVKTATAVSTVAMASFAALTLTLAAVSAASVTAYFSAHEGQNLSAKDYFQIIGLHSQVLIAAFFQFTAQVMGQAVVDGVRRGVSRKIEERISGHAVA